MLDVPAPKSRSPMNCNVCADHKKPVLVVLHQEHSSAGRIGRLLQQRGHQLDIRLPRFGDPLPPTLKYHAGAIIFGGPMSANDSDDYILREIDWIETPLREAKPFLGVCLGAQMLARRLGARVYRHPRERVERGYYRVEATDAGQLLCDGLFPGHVYHWHCEGFDLPRGADLLAQGETFPNQAFRYARGAFGLQFHPEVTFAMMCRWSVKASEQLDAPGAHPAALHRADWFRFDAAVEAWLDVFLDVWLAGAVQTQFSGAARAQNALAVELVA